MSDYCVCCGSEVPEGRQICHLCEESTKKGGEDNGTC